jgi:hypothetical protein
VLRGDDSLHSYGGICVTGIKAEFCVPGGVQLSGSMASVNLAGVLENATREFGLSSDMADADLKISSIPSAWLLSGQAQMKSRLLGKTKD